MSLEPYSQWKKWTKMRTRNLSIPMLICALVLGGCTVDMSQSITFMPPTPTGVITATPPVTSQSSLFVQGLPTVTIPISWSDLNISGALVYITLMYPTGAGQNQDPTMSIQVLDLSSGVITTLCQMTPGGWIYGLSVSPDDREIVMSYSPPGGGQWLYVMPLDGSAPPRQLFSPPSQDDQYLSPSWSADGKYLYYVHVNYALPPIEPDQHYPIFQIYRMVYPDGPPEEIVDQAYWPRLSADSSRLAYVSENPQSGTNKLYVANADGTDAQEVVLSGPYVPDFIDAPLFLPDGGTILFSAPDPPQASVPSWLDRLFGAIPASAHSVPSDWWSVPLNGGVPTRLTQVAVPGLYASLSPDNQHIASFSGYGVFVMNPDGTDLTMVINDVGGILGTVNWIP